MLNKITIRIVALLLIITGLNFIYNATLYKHDLEKNCGEIIKIRDSQQETDVYYFGESSNTSYLENDSIRNSISEITGFFFPGLKITNINKNAVHAGIYKYWLQGFDTKKSMPKAIIITLNLRSFDAGWIHSKLETQLQQYLVMVKPWPHLINRFALSLQAFDNKTEKQREEDMLNDWAKTRLEFPFPFKYKTVKDWDYGTATGGAFVKPDGSWDSDKTVLACHYVKGYAFNISDNNPRVKDFDFINDWCKKNRIKLYLNLMAENIEYADSLVGKELVFLMKQNRDFLVKRYSNNNCKVVDNLQAVHGKEFIDQNWTTEHYSFRGRMSIARNLADSLKNQFSYKYKKAY